MNWSLVASIDSQINCPCLYQRFKDSLLSFLHETWRTKQKTQIQLQITALILCLVSLYSIFISVHYRCGEDSRRFDTSAEFTHQRLLFNVRAKCLNYLPQKPFCSLQPASVWQSATCSQNPTQFDSNQNITCMWTHSETVKDTAGGWKLSVRGKPNSKWT